MASRNRRRRAPKAPRIQQESGIVKSLKFAKNSQMF